MLPLSEVRFTGSGLSRPECVVAHCSGLIFSADWRGQGGVGITRSDGASVLHAVRDAPREIRPNGICLEQGGGFLLTELGVETGGVWRLQPDGRIEPVLLEVEGAKLPPTNFVAADAQGRLWITVSTRHVPRSLAYRSDISDGFIVVLADGRARIVADNLGYTNECLPSADGRYLFVNETFARRLTRFAISGDGLSERTTIAEFGPGTYPDGLTIDAEGALWITSIVSNRVIRISPEGRQDVVIEDLDVEHVSWVEDAYKSGELGRSHLDGIKSQKLRNISSLAFGGADLRTGYLGCLLGDSVATFHSPVAGAPPLHWDYDLGELASIVLAQEPNSNGESPQ